MRVVCWECPGCEHQAHVVWKDTPLMCEDCAAPMERMGTVGVVKSVAEPSRRPHGQGGTTAKHNECGGCGARIGEMHEPGCDWEACPECFQQLIGCEHGDKYLSDDPDA